MKNEFRTERRSVSACFSTALAIGLMSLVFSLATPAEAQSRPPAKSGAAGGANPGSTGGKSGDPNQSGGSGYNPGSSGGSGYNPGSSGGSGYNPGNSGGSGYNPGNSGGGYNPGYNNRSFITVFRDSRFRGGSVQFDSVIDNLKNSGMNDEISSMRVTGTWLVCTDPDFRGQCQTVEGNISKFSVFGMNDSISSLRPIR